MVGFEPVLRAVHVALPLRVTLETFPIMADKRKVLWGGSGLLRCATPFAGTINHRKPGSCPVAEFSRVPAYTPGVGQGRLHFAKRRWRFEECTFCLWCSNPRMPFRKQRRTLHLFSMMVCEQHPFDRANAYTCELAQDAAVPEVEEQRSISVAKHV